MGQSEGDMRLTRLFRERKREKGKKEKQRRESVRKRGILGDFWE